MNKAHRCTAVWLLLQPVAAAFSSRAPLLIRRPFQSGRSYPSNVLVFNNDNNLENEVISSASSTQTVSRPVASQSSTTVAIDLKLLDDQLKICKTASVARRVLETSLLSSNNQDKKALYKSISIPPDASAKGLSDGDLGIMTRVRSARYSIMELIDLNGNKDADRASLAVFSVFVGSTLSALVANENLPGPEIIRFLVVWMFSFAPLILVGYGIADADNLQGGLVQIQRAVFPSYRKRMLQHEAGHFLMSHLLGFPIQTYKANAVKNAVTFYPFADPDVGTNRARQLGFDLPSSRENNDDIISIMSNVDVPFFSPEGRGSNTVNEQSVFRREENRKTNYTAFSTLDKEMQPQQAWPYRGFDAATLDQLTVISVAGVCAEILAYGNAEGGLADFNQLKQLLMAKQLKDGEERMTEREIDNRIRYALGYTMSQLRRHLGALDALAEVMERDGSIAECVYAIETCPNVSGNDGMSEEYEIRRKKQFQQSNPFFQILEKVLIGDPKTADVEENRLVEGKGGGYRKQKYFLTGDDPFYLALGAATVFLLWASSGGLSLH